jgi:hypothetical protein
MIMAIYLAANAGVTKAGKHEEGLARGGWGEQASPD